MQDKLPQRPHNRINRLARNGKPVFDFGKAWQRLLPREDPDVPEPVRRDPLLGKVRRLQNQEGAAAGSNFHAAAGLDTGQSRQLALGAGH